LYAEVKKGNNPVLQKYYKDYCRILTTAINQAKRMIYKKQVSDSTNKITTTWNTINREVRKKARKDNIQILCTEGKNTTNLNTTVEAFNNYFNRIADSIHNQIKKNGTNRNNIS
jgi:TRAP-type mannitol/chloroaromatic compound transport system substrate-binding protein